MRTNRGECRENGPTMTTTTPSTKTFRTARDAERSSKAASVVAEKQAAVTAAEATLANVEDACATEPSAGSFAKARDARRTLEDATRDLELAQRYAAKVEGEIAAAEREAIRAEIARRQSSPLTEIVTEADILRAVELAAACCEIQSTLCARLERRLAEAQELNALRARIGEPQDPPPSADRIMVEAMRAIAEPALAAQRQLGLTHFWELVLPMWRPFGTVGASDDIRAFHPDENAAFRPEGEAQRVHATASRLLAQVQTRRGEIGTPTMIAGAVVKAAAASAAVLALATACMGHG